MPFHSIHGPFLGTQRISAWIRHGGDMPVTLAFWEFGWDQLKGNFKVSLGWRRPIKTVIKNKTQTREERNGSLWPAWMAPTVLRSRMHCGGLRALGTEPTVWSYGKGAESMCFQRIEKSWESEHCRSTEAEAGQSLSQKPAWSSQPVLGQPGSQKETLSWKNKNQNLNKTPQTNKTKTFKSSTFRFNQKVVILKNSTKLISSTQNM